jgi:ribosomal protein L11
LGVQTKAIDEDLKKLAADFKGIRVISEIHVQNRAFTCKFTPGTTAMVIKAMGDYVRDRQKTKLSKPTLTQPEDQETSRSMRSSRSPSGWSPRRNREPRPSPDQSSKSSDHGKAEA